MHGTGPSLPVAYYRRMHRAAILLAAALALASAGAGAQMYRWTDEQGRVRYTDTPPPASAKGARRLQSGEEPPRPAPPPAAETKKAAAAPRLAPLPEVVLYTNSGCTILCVDARNHLLDRGVNFREVEVETPAALDELRKVSGGLSVPVLLVGSAMQKGYEITLFDRALDAAGFPKAGEVSRGRYAAPTK